MAEIFSQIVKWKKSEMVKGLMWGYRARRAKRRHEAYFISKLNDCNGLRLVGYGSESENSVAALFDLCNLNNLWIRLRGFGSAPTTFRGGSVKRPAGSFWEH